MDTVKFENYVREAISDCTGAVRNCALNSIRHVDRAVALSHVDGEMAIFRAITAEEEAVSAIFYSLKNRGYKNSEKLLFKEHTHKLGVIPFLDCVRAFLADSIGDHWPFEKFLLVKCEVDGRRALKLQLKLAGKDVIATPSPPLHFSVSDSASGVIHTFTASFAKMLDAGGFETPLAMIKKFAALRNELLYASAEGIPKVSFGASDYVDSQRAKVFYLLKILLLSDPWFKKNPLPAFVQQCLDSYLLLLERIDTKDLTVPPGVWSGV